MRNYFLVFERSRNEDGTVELQDGCIFLKPHSNPMFQKEFVNEVEILATIQDVRNMKTDPEKLAAAAIALQNKSPEGQAAGLALINEAQGKLSGEIIILNVREL